MAELCGYASRPLAFIFRYIRLRPLSHAVILVAVLGAVACSVGTQYGVKFLVDTLSERHQCRRYGRRFALLGSLIAADNLLWRVASWIANFAFVGVTGDLRRDLFRHLMGHSPGYFADRLPGMLTSRVTATSNAVFTAENMFVWNVLPPCVATVAAIGLGLHHQPADGRRSGAHCRRHGLCDVPSGGRRPAAASRLRQQGRRRRRRDGRCRHQYAAGARLRRLPARTSPFRRDRRSRNGRAAAEPVLSGKAAHLPRRGDDPVDARSAGLGDHAVAAGRGDHRRRRARLHACHLGAERDARSRGGAGRHHPAYRAACRRRSRRCWCRTTCATIPRPSRWSGAAPA